MHRCDHLQPELLITIKDLVFVRAFKWKRFPQLLDDPTARRMLRDVDVQDAPTIMTIQREMVLSESSKPSMRSSPCTLGASQVGLSTTIRKINSRTSIGVGILPTCLRTLEISRQYIRKPVRSQRTTVLGVTMMRDCFQADQTRRAITQKSLSKGPRLGRGCRRFSVRSC
ncbi:MAG: hypothetical protein DMG50_21930 [Acidobacteria bacterium]|nr:MAG: hypothetical protein DMG50_21930 [Acidobacteriota bacterium]